jgi:AraC-like DNA-binding protein
VDETRARILLAEGRFDEAERVALSAVRTLEKGDERSLLAGALVTQGQALARLGEHSRARHVLWQAKDIAHFAGDAEGAGQALLTLLEELGGLMSSRELCSLFERAAGLLEGSKHPAILKRLNNCARHAVKSFSEEREKEERRAVEAESEAPKDDAARDSWKGFSLKHEVQRYEAELIERALHDAGGIVSHAAQLLGFRHHQTFVALLNNRHKTLLHARNPIIPRKRQAARVRATRQTPQHRVRAST